MKRLPLLRRGLRISRPPRDDHAEAQLEISAEPRGEIAALAVDPDDSKSLYIR
jgi:hypothetical protein